MDRLLATFVESPLAAAAGIVAMVCFAIYPAFRSRSVLLSVYLTNNLGFVAHYALLGHWTAVTMNAALGVQTVLAIWLVERPSLRYPYYALIPVLLGATLITWEGLPSILAATAAGLSTLGRLQRDETRLRLLMLASAPVWAAHDLVVGSLPGLIGDLCSLATGTCMLYRTTPAARTMLAACRRTLTAAALRTSVRWAKESAVLAVAGVSAGLPIRRRLEAQEDGGDAYQAVSGWHVARRDGALIVGSDYVDVLRRYIGRFGQLPPTILTEEKRTELMARAIVRDQAISDRDLCIQTANRNRPRIESPENCRLERTPRRR